MATGKPSTALTLTRALQLLEYLRQRPRQTLELAGLLGVSQQAVQRALGSIRAADVPWAQLVTERRGREIWHSLGDVRPPRQQPPNRPWNSFGPLRHGD